MLLISVVGPSIWVFEGIVSLGIGLFCFDFFITATALLG